MSSLTRGELVPFVYPAAFCLSGIMKSIIHKKTQREKVIWWDRQRKFCDVISAETNFIYILKSPPIQCRFKHVVFDIKIFSLSDNFLKIIHHAAWLTYVLASAIWISRPGRGGVVPVGILNRNSVPALPFQQLGWPQNILTVSWEILI